MKKLVSILLLGCLYTFAFAQSSYFITYHPNIGNPGGLNSDSYGSTTGWSMLLDANQSGNAWSSVRSIPFTFEFFGNTVTHFKASGNGLVTFDTSATVIPDGNENLPSSFLPNQTIAGFWDEFDTDGITGSNDRVYTKIFGTAPNRQFWIRWYSYEIAGVSFGYFSTVLEESTHNIYVVEEHTSSQGTDPANFSATVGVQFDAVTAVQYGNDSLLWTNLITAHEDNSYFELFPYSPSSVDIGVEEILSPLLTTCYGTTETITVELENFGTSPIDFASDNVIISVNVSGANTGVYSHTLTSGSLGIGSTISIDVTTSADFSNAGTNLLSASAATASDTHVFNDSAFATMKGLPSGFIAPFLEDFETFVPGTFMNDWSNSISASFGWTVNSGPTSSPDTGPSKDHTLGNGSGTYLYMEASDGSTGDAFELVSPCLDLSGMSFPGLSFWYHMYGDAIGTLEIEIIENGISTSVFSLSGPQQFSEGDAWEKATVNLMAYSGTIQVVFRGIKGTSHTGDIALDDARIVELPPLDVGISKIIEPNGINCFSANETVKVEVTNYGADTVNFAVDNTDITANFTGANTQTFTSSITTGILVPGTSQIFILTTGADLSNTGQHDISVFTTVVGDGDATNDGETATAIQGNAIVAPFFEDFESFVIPSGLMNGWTHGENEEWTVDNAGTPTINTGPDIDHTLGDGSGKYLFTEASGPPTGAKFELVSPCVDLSGLNTPILNFWYHMYGANMGTLEVHIIENGYDSLVFQVSGQQQNSTTELWEKGFVNLSGFSGLIQLKFIGIRGNDITSDIAIDDVSIEETPACPEASNLAIDTLTANSAKISWIDGDSTNAVRIEYGTSGFVWGTGIQVVATSNPMELTGLDPNTPYEAYVISECSTDTSSSTKIAFVTACGTAVHGDSLGDAIQVSKFPFEDIGNTGACYTNQFGNDASDIIYAVNTGPCATLLKISTCGIATDFDTYIHLLDSTGTSIETNDDAPSGACGYGNLFSLIDSFPVTSNTLYYVVVEGFGTAEGIFEVNIQEDPTALIVEVDSVTHNLCQEAALGSIGIDVTGGTASYFFLWSNGDTSEDLHGVPVGDYTATVTDSLGCVVASPSVSITAPDSIQISAISTHTLCPGDSSGSIDISASGGIGPYSFLWSNGDTTEDLSDLLAGNYFVTLTDSNGCIKTSPSFAVNNADSIEMTMIDPTNTQCLNDSTGSIDITIAGGAAPYTYAWNHGDSTEDISGLPVGMYSATITDVNDCSVATSTISISANDSIPLPGLNTTVASDGSGQVFFSSTAQNGQVYTWDFGDSTGTSTVANPDYTYSKSGVYIVMLTVMNDCGAVVTLDTITVEVNSVGVNNWLSNSIQIFPNPSKGIFDVKFEGVKLESAELTVVSIEGKMIYSEDISVVSEFYSHRIVLPETLARGVYIVQVKTEIGIAAKRIRIE